MSEIFLKFCQDKAIQLLDQNLKLILFYNLKIICPRPNVSKAI